MRVTIDINQTTLKQVQKITGETKKSPAISKAIQEFIRRQMAEEFGNLLMENAFDYPCTPEEIQALDR